MSKEIIEPLEKARAIARVTEPNKAGYKCIEQYIDQALTRLKQQPSQQECGAAMVEGFEHTISKEDEEWMNAPMGTPKQQPPVGSNEIIKLLEKVKRPVKEELSPGWWVQENILCYIDQALDILKQQSTVNEKQLIICRPRQIGKMTEWVKQLRPDVKIEESDCQKQRDDLLAACEDGLKELLRFVLRLDTGEADNTISKMKAAIEKAKKEG